MRQNDSADRSTRSDTGGDSTYAVAGAVIGAAADGLEGAVAGGLMGSLLD